MKRLKLFAMCLVLAASCGCGEEPCSGSALVSACGRHIRDITYRETVISEYDFEGITVLGDMLIRDFFAIRKVVDAQLIDGEVVLRFTALPSDADVRVMTCTDCNLGPLSGSGRTFTLSREGRVWTITATGLWIS